MGFELMSGAGEEMENPGKDIPAAIITSGALIAFFYLFATVGILFALPLDQLGLISGILDTLKAVMGDSTLRQYRSDRAGYRSAVYLPGQHGHLDDGRQPHCCRSCQ